jgi:Tol biopolymer transport system component
MRSTRAVISEPTPCQPRDRVRRVLLGLLLVAVSTGCGASTADSAKSSKSGLGHLFYPLATDGPPQLWSVREDGAEQHAIAALAGIGGNGVALSPDGSTWAAGDGAHLVLVDAEGGHRRRLASPSVVGRVVWSPDSKQVAVTLPDNSIGVAGTDGIRLRIVADHATDPVFSPDGTRVAYDVVGSRSSVAEAGGTLVVVRADGTGKPAALSSVASQASWSPDGRRLLFTGPARTIYLADADGSQPTALVRGGTQYAWSPDGSQIAFLDAQGRLAVVAAGGGRPVQLTPVPNMAGGAPASQGAVHCFAWSPDSGRLAFATMELVMVKASGGGTRQVTRTLRPSSVGCPLFWPVPR